MNRYGLQERFQIYVQSIGTLTPGQILEGIPLPLDPDAPFELRSRAVRCQYDASRTEAGLQGLGVRYAGPMQGDYRQQTYIPCGLEMTYFGQQGNPLPLNKAILYPQSGNITVDVRNAGAATLTNVQLYWIGVKLYPWGAVKNYTYPPKMSAKPWTYAGAQYGLTTNVAVTTSAPGPQSIFRPDPDSDFAFRAIGWGPVNQASGQNSTPNPQPYEIFIVLQDEDNKPYMNAPVHLDVLCANPLTGNTFPCAASFIPPIGTGAQAPGTMYPEIYVPKNHILYYNLTRNDGSFAGQVACDVPLQFMGSKVYRA